MRGALPHWRSLLLAIVAMVAAAEVFTILLFYVDYFQGSLRGSLYDVAVLGGVVALVGLAIVLMPTGRWWDRGADLLSTIVLGTVHAAITTFGAASLLVFSLARIPPPLSLLGEDRAMLASLLSSAGLSIGKMMSVLLVVWAAHLLIHALIAPAVVAGVRWLGAWRLRVAPHRMSPAAVTMLAGVVLASAYCAILPQSYVLTEPVRRSLFSSFKMAPADLLLSPPAQALPPGPPLAHPRPVILIVVDALRRDRMGVYDPRLDTTPFLSQLARAGSLTRIDHSFASCTFSFCGIMSILSSLVWDDFGWAPRALPDLLAQRGYSTYAVLSGNHRQFGNLLRLYGARMTYIADQSIGQQIENDDRQTLDRLSNIRFSDPTRSFIYLHLMSAHTGSYLLPQYRPDGPTSDPTSMNNMYPGPRFALRYDMGVRQADEIIRRIFAILEAKGLLTNAIVIITADHGERIGEDGRFLHGGNADERTLSVPLLIYDRSGVTYPARPIASPIDIAPTILTAVGAAIPVGMDGIPLQVATWRNGVPFGTGETTGAVVRLDGDDYQFICNRSTGTTTLRRFNAGQTDGQVIARNVATAPLYERARSAFRNLKRASAVRLPAC